MVWKKVGEKGSIQYGKGEEFDVERVKPRKKKKKKGLHNLYVGGKIRGCGKAIRGRKKAKRIVMKGS